MLQDDEFEQLVTTPERIKALGFKPQKEILTNHLLPYADKLDEESQKFLDMVKTNLAKAVILREMKPACGVWTSRLMKYLRIYGFKFSKQDHITLIKLIYELVTTPELEPNKIHKFLTIFLMLTKRRSLISPKELTLPWRPLYELGKKLFRNRCASIGMFTYQSSLESSYTWLVKNSKAYFELNATKEILEELLPQFNPWTNDTDLVTLIAIFLPVGLHAEEAVYGHELWFDKIMTVWDTCYNAHCSMSDLIILFAGLAKRNPGAVDWTPHVPKMFTRFLHSLNLPVSYKDMQYPKTHTLGTKHIATWIVCTINPDGVVLKHLRSFFGGIESYFNCANVGRWSYKLRDLLRKLSKEFLSRVRREREKDYKVEYPTTKDSYKLRDEDITEFVNIMLEPTVLSINTRAGSLDICVALQNLAILRPDIVVPPLVERLKVSLTSLTEPHRVTAAMSAVAAVARPMLRGPHSDYPEGPTHVVPLLMAVLPGLDPNDIKKTLVTLHFILIFSDMVPLIDCSSAHEYWPDLTDEERLICESTAQFEDFVLIFLERIFIIIESSANEQVRLDTKDSDLVRSKTDAVMETAMSAALTSVIMQCSPKIFKEALRKFRKFATESTFEANISGSMVGIVLRVFARMDSESTLSAFIPKLCEDLHELCTDEVLKEENSPRDLLYRLVLLRNVVECDGTVLLKHIPRIIPVLDRILKLHAYNAITRACSVLNNIFASLSRIDMKEWKSSPNDYGAAPEKWLPIREWGSGCLLKDTNFKWHVPNKEEAEGAQMLADRYLKPEVVRLKQWLSGDRSLCRDRRMRCLLIINAVSTCSAFLPRPDETPIYFFDTQVPALSFPLATCVPYSITLDGENLRAALSRLLLQVQARMLANKTDDTRGLELLIQAWEKVVVLRARTSPGVETRMRSFGVLERSIEGRGGREGGGGGTARLRVVVADMVRLQQDARLDFTCDAGLIPTVQQALFALFELSINTYSTVRAAAQARLYWIVNHHPYSYRSIVPKVVEVLGEAGDSDEWHCRRKGVLFVIVGPKTAPVIAKPDWEIVRALWPALLKSPNSEKPSIVRLELAISELLHRSFMAVNVRFAVSERAVDAAKGLLTEAQCTDAEFAEQMNKAVERETATSDRVERLYLELINDIVDIAQTSNIQWRRLELSVSMLMYMPQAPPGTPYPARAVRHFTSLLNHDNIIVRKNSMHLVMFALKQMKRKMKKVDVDPYEMAGNSKPELCSPGYRKDLEWVIWQKDNAITTDEEWEKPWLRDLAYGFYAWPKKIKVLAPSSEQELLLDMPRERMTEAEQAIYDFFTDKSSVDKLIAFMSVEEKKGKDKFNVVRFTVLKMVFSQFGMRVASNFIAAAQSSAALAEEAPQRYAAEVAAAALKAPRHWPRQPAELMLDEAIRILEIGLNAVTPETIEDWGTCVATGLDKMDPRRGAAVVEGLVRICAPSDTCTGGNDGSFLICGRLYALQGLFSAMSWRVAPLAAMLLERLESANFVQHPYQNVREIIGSLLVTLFDSEVVFPGGERGRAPSLDHFLDSVTPRLAALYDDNGDIAIRSAAQLSACEGASRSTVGGATGVCSAAGPPPARLVPQRAYLHPPSPRDDSAPRSSSPAVQVDDNESADERGSVSDSADKQLAEGLEGALQLAGDAPASRAHSHALNLLTTVLRSCMGIIIRGVNGKIESHYKLLPIACVLASRGPPQPHEELPRAAGGFLGSLAMAQHSSSAFDKALDTLEELADGKSWWARLASLDFAQPLLFYGLPMLCDQPNRAVRAERFTLKLMQDTRVEVRQAAANLMTGLMHCQALPEEDNTIKFFKRSCRSKQLVERHCGVLGLCAYLASRPYTIGSKLGYILTELARHTSSPDPIPATIRKALAEFRRTHHDDWPRHREQLTEEELDLLADLTAPPSYCA